MAGDIAGVSPLTGRQGSSTHVLGGCLGTRETPTPVRLGPLRLRSALFTTATMITSSSITATRSDGAPVIVAAASRAIVTVVAESDTHTIPAVTSVITFSDVGVRSRAFRDSAMSFVCQPT
jgi:hypothetical protein